MKLLIALLAVVGLSGCVAYGGGVGYTQDVYYSTGTPYYSTGTPYYGSSYPGYYYSTPPSTTYIYGGSPRTYRDRDRDGIPNRVDRDRDGDGVPNWRDAAPNDPRRY